eukprot:jgi/Phyca11/542998/estExt2_Genewise1Plus.C_PHYCAscaffold_100554
MSSQSLEETLAFIDQELQGESTGCVEESAFLASLCDEEWDPDELLASIDDELIDFRIESAENDTNSTKGAEKQVNPKRRKRKKQLNSNKARDERRFEVVRLRREAEDLQLTLQKLKAIRSEQGIDTGDASIQGEEEGEIPAVWQEICTRQLNRRLKAENENVKLKKQLEEEKRVVKSIEKMLFKRMALREMDREARKHTRRTKVPNVVTHQPLLRGGMKGMYRRLFDKRHVPFTLQETGDAWWRYWYTYRGRSIVGATSNVVTESYGLEMTDLKTNASATSYGQQILRRHVEENRIVFVWNAYIEPFVFKNQPVSGIYLLEQSHVLIKPEVTEEGDECSTSMSTCYVITPHFLDPKLKDDPETTALINFLVSALSANIRNRNEAVENLLLDEALQKHHNS